MLNNGTTMAYCVRAKEDFTKQLEGTIRQTFEAELFVEQKIKTISSPVSFEEVSEARRFPPDGRLYLVIWDVSAIIHQFLRVAGLQVGFPEQPVLASYRWIVTKREDS